TRCGGGDRPRTGGRCRRGRSSGGPRAGDSGPGLFTRPARASPSFRIAMTVSTMTLEVEQKFRVARQDQLRSAIASLNPQTMGVQTQRDVYYNHPARDFATTDEALRLRTVGDSTVVTYKGAKLPGPTKTRREIELPVVSAEG